jgi:DNA-binding transcriptional ArsR family regulator
MAPTSGRVTPPASVPVRHRFRPERQPTVSHHTKTLSDAGLIVGDKRGRWVWWSIVPERVQALHDALAVKATVAT